VVKQRGGRYIQLHQLRGKLTTWGIGACGTCGN